MTIAVEPVSTAPARAEMIVTPSGIEVWRVHSEVVPVAAMSFVFEGGASQDPMERPGIAQMTAQLLDEGGRPLPVRRLSGETGSISHRAFVQCRSGFHFRRPAHPDSQS